jgi:hypothetical protein
MKETSHPPPGSKIFALLVVPQKETHTREETEKLKSSEVEEQGRQKKKSIGRIPRRYIERFQSSEPREKKVKIAKFVYLVFIVYQI